MAKIGYQSLTFCGTPDYLAPEIVLGHVYGKNVDWWCLGALVYEMLTGNTPFWSEDIKETFKNILSKQIPMPEYLSFEAKSLL